MRRMVLLLNVFVTLVAVVVVSGGVMGQKRSAVADLDMLIADPGAYGNVESNGRTGNYDTSNFISLADTLKKLQELQRYYSHQGRTRYGRSTPETYNAASNTPFHQAVVKNFSLRRQRRSPV